MLCGDGGGGGGAPDNREQSRVFFEYLFIQI